MPKDRYVIDAGVLALYFGGRPDVKPYFDRIHEGSAAGYMCEINVAEFLYNYARSFGWDAAKVKINLLRKSEVEFPVVDDKLSEGAAKLKLDYPKFSLADCFLVATALELDSAVLTNDEDLRNYKRVKIIEFE